MENRSYYSDVAWRMKGKELLDNVQDLDAELRIANRNLKLLISTLPITMTLALLPQAFLFFVTFSWIVAIFAVCMVFVAGGHIASVVNLLARTGKTKYDESLPHKVEKARRKYHEWLEVDAEYIPPKPEPKLVSTEVLPKGKITSRKIGVEELEVVNGHGEKVSAYRPVSDTYIFTCITCCESFKSREVNHINDVSRSHKNMGHKVEVMSVG